jgi:hypothetical protein
MRRLRKFIQLPLRDQRLLLEATFFIATARLALLVLPFRWIAPWRGKHMAVTSETQADRDDQIVRGVQEAIRRTSNNVPWKTQCLAQAIAATIMLQWRKIEGTVYLGIAKEGQTEVMAHAWLRSGRTIVTGSQGREQHSVVATFAFPPRSCELGKG